jgi:hypothetical protein
MMLKERREGEFFAEGGWFWNLTPAKTEGIVVW